MSDKTFKRLHEMEPGNGTDHFKRYKVGVYCTNCGKHGAIYILKGVRKEDCGTVKCDDCECEVKP